MPAVLRVAILLAVVAAARPAHGQPDPAEEGMRLYRAGDYAAAAERLREAHAQHPSRDLLFAWAQAERLSGDCATAIPLYQRVLADDPPPEQADAVRLVLTLCEETV